MATSVRHRSQQKQNLSYPDGDTDNSKLKQPQNEPATVHLLHWLFILTINTFVVYYSHHINTRFPTAHTKQTATEGQFVESNAREYLEGFVDFGSRPVGSVENENFTVDYLLSGLDEIVNAAHPTHKIELDSKRSSGSYVIGFLGGFTSIYENVNNVVVKFEPPGGCSDHLLVNCHYDSVINGTGASDDAVSCSLMLEVLRVLSKESTPTEHGIIFLFNGAEENILQASHGFVTQHPWARTVRAFVNLEAAGAGGRELLFQAGPENPWIVQLYADNVPHPFASVIGQEVFESGVIPSDTDYRIFRDYGGLPGLDIAYISNGYVYHTPQDDAEMIPEGCIQRGGDNLLALVKAIVNSPYLRDPGEYRHGKLVFFDVLGFGMIVYPQRLGVIINLITVAVVLLGLSKKIASPGKGSLSGNYLRHLSKALGILLASWILTIAAVALIGFLMDLIGQPMSWFTNVWLLIGLYAAPSMLILLLVNEASKACIFDGCGPWEVEKLFLDANLTLFSVILTVLTLNGVSSAVLILTYVLLPLVIREKVMQIAKINGKDHVQMFFCLHMLGTLVPSTLFLYSVYTALIMFIPIMGRTGPGSIPDIFIGVLVALAVVMSTTYHIGLVYISKSTKSLQSMLVGIWLVMVVLATSTPIGFPYGSNPKAPSRQRHIIHHIERTFHDHTGYVFKHDSGILHLPFDKNSIHLLTPHMPVLKEAELIDCKGPYCGWPYYFPLVNRMREAYFISSSAPELSPRAYLKKISSTSVGEDVERWTFQISGPSHNNIYISPREGVQPVRWSIGDGEPHETEMPANAKGSHYFIYYAYGTRPDNPYEFWVDFKISKGLDRSTGSVEIALGAHYVTTDGTNKVTPELESYIQSFPDWAIPIGWAATYEMWTF